MEDFEYTPPKTIDSKIATDSPIAAKAKEKLAALNVVDDGWGEAMRTEGELTIAALKEKAQGSGPSLWDSAKSWFSGNIFADKQVGRGRGGFIEKPGERAAHAEIKTNDARVLARVVRIQGASVSQDNPTPVLLPPLAPPPRQQYAPGAIPAAPIINNQNNIRNFMGLQDHTSPNPTVAAHLSSN